MVERMERLRRRERTVVPALGAVALVAVVLALAACSGGGGGGAGATPVTTSTTAVDATTTTAAPATTTTTIRVIPPEPDDTLLADVLLDTVPASGFTLLDDPASTGPLDLAAAAAFESDDDAERQLLETRGFQRGYIRSWSDGEGGAIVLEVYRFATPEGAAAYQEDGFVTLEGFGAEFFDVADIPGARGFAQAATAGDATASVFGVAFTHDNLFFLVLVSAPGSGVSSDDARALAIGQAANAGVTLTPGG